MKELIFESQFDAVICLDADIPDKNIFDLFEIPVLASDGAGVTLTEMGVLPDKIIGDLDSFYAKRGNEKIPDNKLIFEEDQETNDFEKCLKYCLNNDFRNVLIVGFHGGLLEHTLNNWSVFKRYAKQLDLCIYDKDRYCIPLHNSIKAKLKEGEIISLIPQPTVNITTTGFKWELKDEVLELGTREGARNVAENGYIEIQINDGEILMITDNRLPYSPNFK